MELLMAFLTYLGKFVAMIAVVVCGYLCGKKVRDCKNKRSTNLTKQKNEFIMD